MSNSPQEPSVVAALDALRVEIAELRNRVLALEANRPAAAIAERPAAETISPEILAAISAALAAYFGLMPRIRQIRLLSGGAWAQQGRVTIQASHMLTNRHD